MLPNEYNSARARPVFLDRPGKVAFWVGFGAVMGRVALGGGLWFLCCKVLPGHLFLALGFALASWVVIQTLVERWLEERRFERLHCEAEKKRKGRA
ncbi:MAG TPA: hypothetical protein VHW03_10070 [Chthoniobacterales bacterium]|jgi:hypothetical protein|nr:hypothetical protein [Chthoniobacterales bacterium]